MVNLIFDPKANSNYLSEELSLLYGGKGFGLVSVIDYTPRFFLVSTDLYKAWKETDNSDFFNLLSEVYNTIKSIFGLEQSLIIRSSAVDETIYSRGLYLSKSIKDIANIETYINTIFLDFKDQSDSNIALIVQKEIKYAAKGHLSNERRVSKNKNSWLIEVEEASVVVNNMIARFKSQKPNNGKIDFKTASYTEAENSLKRFASIYTKENLRFHFEWIWDYQEIYIVQQDTEEQSTGMLPGKRWSKENIIETKRELEVIKDFTNCKIKWKKLNCLYTFADAQLPHAHIYVLNGETIFKSILRGNINYKLLSDLEWVLQYPTVIRTDVNSNDNTFLLPRTDTISTKEEALDFVSKTLLEFRKRNISLDSICFLFHRFISSSICALTYSKPGSTKIKIDSTWGLPDGLHCFSYDSYEFNIEHPTDSKIKLSCKSQYLDCDANGKWVSVQSGWNLDWKRTLTESQLKDISVFSKKISESLNCAVGIMFFVDVDESSGHPSILPWYYTEEIPEFNSEPANVMFPKKQFVLKNRKDLESLKVKSLNNELTVKLKISPDYVRNRDFIVSVGKFLYENKIPTVLEGSVLSHIYYILKREKVSLKCSDPFNPEYKAISFNKLVRDRIPDKINLNGEQAVIGKLNHHELIEMLKQKLVEEALELNQERDLKKLLSEAADVYEVLTTLIESVGSNLEEVKELAEEKRTKVGGFKNGIYLMKTKDLPILKKTEHGVKRKLYFLNEALSEDLIKFEESDETIQVEFSLIPPISKKARKEIKISKEIFKEITIKYESSKLYLTIQEKRKKNPFQLNLFGEEPL